MKTLKTLIIIACLAGATAGYAQTVPTTPTSPATPSTPATVPAQDPTTTSPASTNPTTEKKAEFNSPQSPVKPSGTPSEDTLIKSQRVGGAIIQDSLVPTSGKKSDRMNRKKNKKSGNEADTASIRSTTEPTRKP